MNWTATAAILLAVGVMLGAFGAHALRDRLDEYSKSVYERAVLYHFIHALGLLIVSIFPRTSVLAEWVSWLLFSGIVIFCGSLYLLAITGVRSLGAITPIGGVSFIAAWLLLAYWLLTSRK